MKRLSHRWKNTRTKKEKVTVTKWKRMHPWDDDDDDEGDNSDVDTNLHSYGILFYGKHTNKWFEKLTKSLYNHTKFFLFNFYWIFVIFIDRYGCLIANCHEYRIAKRSKWKHGKVNGRWHIVCQAENLPNLFHKKNSPPANWIAIKIRNWVINSEIQLYLPNGFVFE